MLEDVLGGAGGVSDSEPETMKVTVRGGGFQEVRIDRCYNLEVGADDKAEFVECPSVESHAEREGFYLL